MKLQIWSEEIDTKLIDINTKELANQFVWLAYQIRKSPKYQHVASSYPVEGWSLEQEKAISDKEAR